MQRQRLAGGLLDTAVGIAVEVAQERLLEGVEVYGGRESGDVGARLVAPQGGDGWALTEQGLNAARAFARVPEDGGRETGDGPQITDR